MEALGMAIKEHRPVVCYSCGRVLGTLEITLGPDGMRAFREQARALRDKHRCGAPEREKQEEN
ncbi:MAG: hypothetical protein GX161_14510 [Firmicutes bacterium]|nr:hypothetical protein [Bacillota bacterium]